MYQFVHKENVKVLVYFVSSVITSLIHGFSFHPEILVDSLLGDSLDDQR